MCLKHYLRIVLVAGMAMVGAACQKDNQSFEYEKINDIKVTDAVIAYTVVQLDSLIITPTLSETLAAGDSFSYSWTIDSKIVSTSKNLRLKVQISPGTYTAIYKVTSNKNGISTFARYTITVNGAYPNGWYVVNTKDGKGKVSLIRGTDDYIFDNPMETANNKTYSGKPLALYNYENGGFFYYFTDQGAYRFNMNDWFELGSTSTILPSLSTSLPFKTTPVWAPNNLKYDQFIVADGALYVGVAGSAAYGTAADNVKPFSERIPGDYQLFPGVFPGNIYLTYFYDTKAKRFMQMQYNTRTLVNSSSLATASFDMGNVGKTMIAYDRGISTTGNQGIEWYYVMENSTGRFLLSMTATAGASTPGYNQQMLNSPEIASADNFATSSILKQLYYTVGNKVYLYDMLANSARLIYTFPTGYVIKDIEMLRSTSKQLVIGVNNGNAGEVYYFDIDALGLFTNSTYAKKFTGFGEIVQIANARQYL